MGCVGLEPTPPGPQPDVLPLAPAPQRKPRTWSDRQDSNLCLWHPEPALCQAELRSECGLNGRTRTAGLVGPSHALCRLSYIQMWSSQLDLNQHSCDPNAVLCQVELWPVVGRAGFEPARLAQSDAFTARWARQCPAVPIGPRPWSRTTLLLHVVQAIGRRSRRGCGARGRSRTFSLPRIRRMLGPSSCARMLSPRMSVVEERKRSEPLGCVPEARR